MDKEGIYSPLLFSLPLGNGTWRTALAVLQVKVSVIQYCKSIHNILTSFRVETIETNTKKLHINFLMFILKTGGRKNKKKKQLDGAYSRRSRTTWLNRRTIRSSISRSQNPKIWQSQSISIRFRKKEKKKKKSKVSSKPTYLNPLLLLPDLNLHSFY